ncbi:MAG: hypothetical protein RLZ51_1451 [Pseudomonadota bacterium]|jgi:uncharacterized protein YaeQ
MALRATVHKLDLSIADIDRGVYGDHSLTLALHPSETAERMMLRVLAFILHADADLRFGPGLSSEGEADLLLSDPTGRIRLWVEVGLPESKWIRKAASQADAVSVLAYGGHKAEVWWRAQQADLERFDALEVILIAPEQSAALAALAARTMRLQATVQEGQVWVSASDDPGKAAVLIEPQHLRRAR